MTRTGIVALLVLLAVLLAIDLWLAPNLALEHSATSFGVGRSGYKAAFDLFDGLGFHPYRDYLPPVARAELPLNLATRWFVAPGFLAPEKTGARAEAGDVLRWVRAGATAVIFGSEGSEWKRMGLDCGISAGGESSVIHGSIARGPRKLPIAGLLRFSACRKPGDAGDRVVLTADGAPFAFERNLGAGRLIAVADSRFLRNADLGLGAASLVAADLAVAFGPPSFDEWSHGFAPPGSLASVLIESRSVLPILIGIIAAIAWIFEQHSWPRRMLQDSVEQPGPSIAAFINSLGTLYAKTGDPAAALRAYRAGFLRRMRRQLSPGAELSEEVLLARLARDGAMTEETRKWLIDQSVPANQDELVRAVRAIESYRSAVT